MIAIDMDGTLLNPHSEVTPRARAAVQALVAAGWIVCFATGRTWPESESVLDDVGHLDAAVFIGGAMVVDTANRQVLHRTIMRPELAADVCRYLESHGHPAFALQDRAHSDVDYLISGNIPMAPEAQLWMQVAGATTRPVADLGAYLHDDTIRVSTAGTPPVMTRLLADINGAFGARIQSHTVGLHALATDVMEVFDPAVDKWQGILKVAAARGVRPDQIIAVGDNMNDLSMIRGAALGVAMGNAKPAVKAAAARVIGPNTEDGIALFLEELAAAK
jgi:Cof subfamily protein (haloacid dehalogenase superfamily)